MGVIMKSKIETRAKGALYAVLIAGLFSGCASIKVDSYHDASVEFPTGKTYRWMTRKHAVTIDPRADVEFVSARVQAAVERELAARGYRKVKESPALLLGYHAAIEEKLRFNTVSDVYSYSYAPGYDRARSYWRAPQRMDTTTYVEEYAIGSLIVDIVDAKSNKLAWRGTARTRVDQSDNYEKKKEIINRAIQKLLVGFPPSAVK
jgi:hypothetical protein